MSFARIFFQFLLISLIVVACEKKKDETPETTTEPTTPAGETNGALTFNGTKYDLSAASYRLSAFEYEKSGRYHVIALTGPSLTVENEEASGSGLYLTLGVMTDASNIKNIVGDFSNDPKWANSGDARTAPNYSAQEMTAIVFDNSNDIAELGIDTVTEFTITEANGEYTISIKGEGVRYINSDEPGTIEVNFTGAIPFVDDYIIPTTTTLGTPQFTASVPSNSKIVNTAWTGSKLWALTDNCSKLLEIDKSNGDTLQVISQCSGDPNGIGSLYYVNGDLYGSYRQTTSGNTTFFRKRDASTGAYIGDWTYTSPDGEIRQDSYLASDGNSIYSIIDVIENGGATQKIAKFDLNGDFQEIVMEAEYDHMIYGGGSFWALQHGGDDGIIYELNSDLEVQSKYFIDNVKTLTNPQFGGEIKMYLVYINAELWIVDLDNNFYKTGIN